MTTADPNDPQARSDSEQQQDAAAAAAAAFRRATRSASSTSRSSTPKRRPRAGRASYSDSRDPQPIAAAVERLITDNGWQDQSAAARVTSEWKTIVGAELAAHVQPGGFHEGELLLTAESTAWATQMRLLLADVHRAIDAHIGAGVVTRIRVEGPRAPSWKAGPRSVKGRGPRDTYG